MSTVSDYAKLASIMTIDANGNRVQTAPDPLGRAVGVAVLGNEGDNTGNSLGGFKGEVDQQTLDAFFTTPYGDTARSLLAKASRRTIYDIDSYRRSGVPSRVAELTRHDHVGKGTDVSPITVRITYLGGCGVGIQSTLLSSDTGKTEWDFDGWVINDNKGQPVQKFQPSRASSHAFRPLPPPSDGTVPVTTRLRDPLGKVLGVLYPDHTWSKTRFTPWTKADYDAGNTSNVEDPATDDDVGSYFERLPRSLYYPTWRQKRMADGSSAEDKIAARQGDVYADAPTITHLDAPGRTILTDTGNGVDTRHARVDYNPRGQVGRLRDVLDRTAEKVSYDLLGRQLHTANMDRGRRWLLSDSDGLPLLSWSDKQTRKRSECDALRRLKSVWRLSSEEHAVEMEVTKMTYGEGRPDDTASNLRGQVYQCRDQAGLLTNSKFDVLGGCTVSTRRYANEYRNMLDWSSVKDEEASLEKDEHKTECRYNALNLPVDNVAPDLGMTRRQYDVAGRLAALESFKKDGTGAATSSTKSIKYNANGMITDLMYGDKTRSTNTYDEQTQRLVATRTIRTTDNAVLQDVSYTYDCRVKVVQTKDTAKIVVNDADSTQEYHYDCLGQLVQATGRIQVDSQSKHLTPYSFNDGKPAGDSKTIRYTETYAYDKAGNILTMSNTPNPAGYTGWTRTYTYAEQSCITAWKTSNRLTRTEVGKVTEEYKYEGDAGRQGCMKFIPGYSHLSWNDDDRLHSFSTQNVGADSGNTPEMTWYVYDAEEQGYSISAHGGHLLLIHRRRSATIDAPRAYRFASYRWDSKSGLYACGARYYAPWLGRWTSADPIGAADGLNLFAYVRNDPINFDDPGGTIKNRKYNRSLSESSSHEQASGSSGTFSSLRDIPAAVAHRLGSSLFDANPPPPVASGFIRLWRATDQARGTQFVRFGDVSAVRTTSIGNFNRPGEPAAYWAATRASAEAHAKHLMRADKKALIHMDVPESVLASGTAGVHNYGPEASAQWRERVGYYSIPDDRLASEIKQRNRQNQIFSTMDEHNLSEWDDAEKMVNQTYEETAETTRANDTAARILAERAAEVTIGAETPVILNSRSTVFELENGPEMQYAFKRGAYGRLTGYRSGLVRYQGGGQGRSWWWRCQLL
ncbi:SpvB domain-containing protein, partial [Metarhizium majus ARSEF 297]